jgi:hypothetical protein
MKDAAAPNVSNAERCDSDYPIYSGIANMNANASDEHMTTAEDLKSNKEHMAGLYLDPIPAFYAEFIDFIAMNVKTMKLESYQDFVSGLYKSYCTGDRIDFVMADINESFVIVSQIHPERRNREFVKKESDHLSISQKTWMRQVMKDLGW